MKLKLFTVFVLVCFSSFVFAVPVFDFNWMSNGLEVDYKPGQKYYMQTKHGATKH